MLWMAIENCLGIECFFSHLIALLINFSFIFDICPTYLFLQLDTGFKSVQFFRGTRGVIHTSLLAQVSLNIFRLVLLDNRKIKTIQSRTQQLLLKCTTRLKLTQTFLHFTGLCYTHPILKYMGNESTYSFIIG